MKVYAGWARFLFVLDPLSEDFLYEELLFKVSLNNSGVRVFLS